MPNNLLCQPKVHLKDLYCIAQSVLSDLIDCFTLSFLCLLKINIISFLPLSKKKKKKDFICFTRIGYDQNEGIQLQLQSGFFGMYIAIFKNYFIIHSNTYSLSPDCSSLQTDQVRNRGQCSTGLRTQRIYCSEQIILLNLSTSYKTWICHSK